MTIPSSTSPKVKPIKGTNVDQELNDLLEALGGAPIPFLKTTPDANGNIHLGRDVVIALRHAISQIIYAQEETGCTLKTFAVAFRAFEYDGEISSEDAEALAVVAKAMAERARDNVELIRSLLN